MATFSEVIPLHGFLTDKHITEALNQGFLLEKGSWNKEQIRHASYTLRLGDQVHIARAGGSSTSETKTFEVLRLVSGQRFPLNPGDTALLYSSEILVFPDCVLGFTVARGLLFAEGLCPENTYVDPGFTGPIYTTVTNVSSRVIHFEYGMPLARLFFFHLGESVHDGYRRGSSFGIDQQLKSVTVTALSTPAECRQATDTQLLESINLIPIGGIHAAEALRRAKKRQLEAERRLWLFAAFWPAALFAIENIPFIREFIESLTLRLLVSLALGAIVSFVTPKLIARWKGNDERI